MHQFQGNWFKLLFPPIEGGVTATVRLVSGLTGCSFTQFGFATGANDVANAFATSVRGCRGLWREGRTKDTVPGPGGGGGGGDCRGRRANCEGQRSPAALRRPRPSPPRRAPPPGAAPPPPGRGGAEQVEAQWAGGSRGRMATH